MRWFRLGTRTFTSHPSLAAAVVLTLAIGLGAVTAILSIADALLWRPLPYPDSDRIVALHADIDGGAGRLALREYRELEREQAIFSRVGAYYLTQYNLTGDGPPQALTCTIPSSTVFDVLGVQPHERHLRFVRMHGTAGSRRVLRHPVEWELPGDGPGQLHRVRIRRR